MATPVQEKSLAGNIFKKKIAYSQRGLSDIPLFLIYVFQVLSMFSTFTGYFCLNHYITKIDVMMYTIAVNTFVVFIFLFVLLKKTSTSIISKTMICQLDHSAYQPFIISMSSMCACIFSLHLNEWF